MKVLVDHHQPQPDFDYGISDTTVAPPLSWIYADHLPAGDEHYIDNDIVQCIYAGTMIDTGSFLPL